MDIDASLPNYLYDSNVAPVDAAVGGLAAEDLLCQVERLGKGKAATRAADGQTLIVHMARDFHDVTRLPEILQALAYQSVQSKLVSIERDGRMPYFDTLRHNLSHKSQAYLYDKSAESKPTGYVKARHGLPTPPGHGRFEVRATKKFLMSQTLVPLGGAMLTVGTLDDLVMDQLCAAIFARQKFDTEVSLSRLPGLGSYIASKRKVGNIIEIKKRAYDPQDKWRLEYSSGKEVVTRYIESCDSGCLLEEQELSGVDR